MLFLSVLLVVSEPCHWSFLGRSQFIGVRVHAASALCEKCAEPSQFVLVRPQDPVPPPRGSTTVDPSAFRPVAQFEMTHLKFARQVDEPPFVLLKWFRLRAVGDQEPAAFE